MVNSLRERASEWYDRRATSITPILLIILAVLLANIMYVSGLSSVNPITWTANISTFVCHVSCGRPMIDPNVGFISQPLGHLAATDLLHGHIPWWNYFEGLGQPLVGEMQAAALFPLTLLLAMSNGLLWFHICLQLIAGISTYFLARRLNLPVFLATGIGVLFALNGTYAWIGNSVMNPVTFLPMLLLGVEIIVSQAPGSAKKGWCVAALALALSLYAGFPEVAYFDGLFALAWSLVRLFEQPRHVRRKTLERFALAGFFGALLSLPALIPWLDFLKVANIGRHASAVALGTQAHSGLAMFIDPYVFSTIFANPSNSVHWGTIGGYFTASVATLALVGLFGKTQRHLRVFLGTWTLVSLFGMFNFLDARKVWNLIPLVKNTIFPRYDMASCEMALIVLAGLGIMDLATSDRARRRLLSVSIAMLLVLAWCTIWARTINADLTFSSHRGHFFFFLLQAAPILVTIALIVLASMKRLRIAPLLVTVVLVAESLFMFAVPTVETATNVKIDYAPIDFLASHEGQYRFLDVGVIYPNWGTQFGLNSLGSIDLPYPKDLSNFIEKYLYPGLNPSNQFVIHNGITGIVAQENEVAEHLHAYEGASVKYLIEPSSVSLLPSLKKLGITQVFSDNLATIVELPDPRAFFSTSSKSCSVTSANDNVATVNCTKPGATLLRTELEMSGWKATVNGKSVPITTIDGVYQQVTLPQGTATVRYSFFPPHERYALLLGFLSGLFLIGTLVNERWPYMSLLRRKRS